ncbi:MAG TPA: Xaa-Pro peptidase family protein [Candidatus Thermoplasmatota archaeon]|nr:Xaa-Pro peptidase family protein [Candidatus Thermoplasmatota archaeon]
MASKAAYQARGRRIFREVRRVKGGAKVDAIVVANGTMPILDLSFFYLTGFERGVFERSGVVLYPSGRMSIFTGTLEEESAKSRKGELFVFRQNRELEEWLAESLSGCRAVGVNAPDLSHKWAKDLRRWGKAPLVDVSPAIHAVRGVKDGEELRRMRKAAAIASDAAASIPEILRTGITEQEAAAKLEYEMSRRGSSAPSFSTICGFGASSSEPHYVPGKVKLRPGMFALFDFGGTFGRYCSDITRTFIYGTPTPKHKEIYSIVLESNLAGIDMMVEGVSARKVHERCAEIIDRTKYKGRFIHSTGHSIGLAVHDGGQGISRIADFTLKEGQVFSCEPGIYVPGFGGVRIEDDVVIGKSKAKVLTYAEKEQISVRAR